MHVSLRLGERITVGKLSQQKLFHSVDDQNRVVAVGYNGFPAGCSDAVFPWKSSDKKTDLHSKEPYVCNSIMNGERVKSSCSLEAKFARANLFFNEIV